MSTPPPDDSSVRAGVLQALAAYGMWGLFPLYWSALKRATAGEVLGHRIVGTFVLLVVLLVATRRLRILASLTRRQVLLLAGASLLITANWLTYIWGVQNGHVVEAALGYFINPLVSVALGVWLLREGLRPPQKLAIGVAAVAVAVLTSGAGRIPWIALVLASSFGLYGLLKKRAAVPALPALLVETAFVAPVAAWWLWRLHEAGTDTLFRLDGTHDALMLGAGVATAVPLLFFGAAANRVPLATLGMLQYVAPCIQFLCGVVILREPMSARRWVGFLLVWLALALLSADGLRTARLRREGLRPPRPNQPA